MFARRCILFPTLVTVADRCYPLPSPVPRIPRLDLTLVYLPPPCTLPTPTPHLRTWVTCAGYCCDLDYLLTGYTHYRVRLPDPLCVADARRFAGYY